MMMINEHCFALDRQAELNQIFNLLAHRSINPHANLPRHIILTLGQPVFALTPKCCMLSREAANTHFNVFGLTMTGIYFSSEP